MADIVYRVTELVGVSSESWEAAARNAIETAAKSLTGRRIAQARRFDTTIEDGKVTSYRVRLNVQVRSERLAGLPPPSRPREFFSDYAVVVAPDVRS